MRAFDKSRFGSNVMDALVSNDLDYSIDSPFVTRV